MNPDLVSGFSLKQIRIFDELLSTYLVDKIANQEIPDADDYTYFNTLILLRMKAKQIEEAEDII